MPKRPPALGTRKVGDLKDRTSVVRSTGNQNMAGGGRYDIREMVKEDTQNAFNKIQMLKMQGQAKFPLKDGNYIELDPIKRNSLSMPQS